MFWENSIFTVQTIRCYEYLLILSFSNLLEDLIIKGFMEEVEI